jgi:hypothetical protein
MNVYRLPARFGIPLSRQEHLPPSMHWIIFPANVRAFCCFIHPLDQEQAPHQMGLV